MQVRTSTYLQFASRSLRHLMRPFDRATSAETQPLLIYITAALFVLLAVLEIDAHKAELESLGLLANNYPVPAALLAP